ncbi:hypothetical protein FB451DRAFT_1171445 [Mycena latifolia]|nr:hypothetical protein FB451DRAFT_1171445 [Mycena latifolia]
MSNVQNSVENAAEEALPSHVHRRCLHLSRSDRALGRFLLGRRVRPTVISAELGWSLATVYKIKDDRYKIKDAKRDDEKYIGAAFHAILKNIQHKDDPVSRQKLRLRKRVRAPVSAEVERLRADNVNLETLLEDAGRRRNAAEFDRLIEGEQVSRELKRKYEGELQESGPESRIKMLKHAHEDAEIAARRAHERLKELEDAHAWDAEIASSRAETKIAGLEAKLFGKEFELKMGLRTLASNVREILGGLEAYLHP